MRSLLPPLQAISREVGGGEVENNCPCGCARATETKKVVTVDSNVIIQVCRYPSNGGNLKNRTRIEIPRQLSINAVSGPVELELYGAIVHAGDTLANGHYQTIVRKGTEYWEYDGDKATEFDPANLPEETVCMLLYRRECDTPELAFPAVAAAARRIFEPGAVQPGGSKSEGAEAVQPGCSKSEGAEAVQPGCSKSDTKRFAPSKQKASARLCALSENGGPIQRFVRPPPVQADGWTEVRGRGRKTVAAQQIFIPEAVQTGGSKPEGAKAVQPGGSKPEGAEAVQPGGSKPGISQTTTKTGCHKPESAEATKPDIEEAPTGAPPTRHRSQASPLGREPLEAFLQRTARQSHLLRAGGAEEAPGRRRGRCPADRCISPQGVGI